MASEHVTPPPSRASVIVIGGGLAGMAAACRLLNQGYPVTLVEKRPFLGGRAFSFVDPETGCQVDNGQHVFLGCCTYYIDFLKELGTFPQAHLQPSLYVRVLGRDGRVGTLSSAPLPPPFHLMPSFLRYCHLGLRDKLLALYALARIRFTQRHKPHLEEMTFYQWLKARHQTERAIDNFWNLILRPALNDDVRSVSAAMGLMVFQEGLLKGRHSADIGYATVGLSPLMGDAARDYILQRGGKLVLGKPVSRLLAKDGRMAGVELSPGEVLQGDLYISALPFDALRAVLPSTLAQEPFFAGLGQLTTAPIVDLHVWYDRPVMEEEFAAFLGSPLQWVFNKTKIQGEDNARGQYLCVSLSGAWNYVHKSKEELRELFLEEVSRVFPQAREARVERFLVVKEERATFRCLPGAARFRPPAVTPIENLFLAGEWTDTGWPSTMEGAVRSGIQAARAVITRRPP